MKRFSTFITCIHVDEENAPRVKKTPWRARPACALRPRLPNTPCFMKCNTISLRKCRCQEVAPHRVRLTSPCDVNTPPSCVTLGQQRMITRGAVGSPLQDADVAGIHQTTARRARPVGRAALCTSGNVWLGMLLSHRPCARHVRMATTTRRQEGWLPSKLDTFHKTFVCTQNWFLIVPVVVMIAAVSVFTKRHVEMNGQRTHR